MFIHFDSNEAAACDDCGNSTSIMHISVRRSPCGLDLCLACCRALALAMVQASEKLGSGSRTVKSAAVKPGYVPA
jgi:hypothetical protein